jgi:hypothetical protein
VQSNSVFLESLDAYTGNCFVGVPDVDMLPSHIIRQVLSAKPDNGFAASYSRRSVSCRSWSGFSSICAIEGRLLEEAGN